ncbi:Arylsulfatase [Planctomycetes bacterium Pan216]|uniref:Arylsulfatase n=1 Tax=Kolteria novifilia TaxID=2527975 RepID=A0A518B490_9BACT|nr:Arylsulfatase [Planctomycetes bacterium Pan216]
MTSLLFSLLLVASGADTKEQAPPNVVMIVSDDQAYSDFGFMGHPTIKTPNIDRLAKQSATFPNGYVPNSLCRPSLVTLLTGLYPHQHGVHFNDPPKGGPRQSAEKFIKETPTLPRLLASAGYRCLQTGKFWEGNYRNAGFTDGMTHGDPSRADRHPTLGMLRGRHGDLGLTIGRDGMQPIEDFLDDVGQKPFFVWYAPFMPHTPYKPPQRLLKHYLDAGMHPHQANYAAMCTWFDETVGELMGSLEKRGLADNTIVVFVIDNGWITDTTGKRPRYAPKSKRSPFEGGVRTPIMFRWPGHIPPKEYPDLVNSIDIVPTVLTACGFGEKTGSMPGVNLLPLMEKGTPLKRDAVFGEIFAHDASTLGNPPKDLYYRWVRHGDWKLIDSADPNEKDMLFNLASDPKEEHNLVDDAKSKDKLDDLQRRLDEWWNPST